ncbi:tetratricopeptide repeat protein [Thauera aromatica]|uniref:tetratricopeptide repeat protein n=1 Tax=Thauera aromatica TaxID=59405 RepID=UPI001FFC2E41|nr:tetratricopeptide repeat protein [Thauera aromatica]MCK2097398.1 tetratricopeptide repeat protein [Thauera aromatica]
MIRNTAKLARAAAVLTLLAVTPGALARTEARSVEQRYQAALAAIEAQDIDAALAELESLITALPDHAGAWLELAILMCTTGAGERAEALFRHIEQRFAPPPAIREVIAHYRDSGCSTASAPRLHGQLSVVAGWDSNASLGTGSDRVRLGSAGNLIELQVAPALQARASALGGIEAEASTRLGPRDTEVFVQVAGRHFPAARDFDTHSWALAVAQPLRWRSASLQSQISAGAVQLHMDNRRFQNSTYLSWVEPLRTGDRPNDTDQSDWTLELNAVLNRFDINRNFDSNVVELRLRHSGAAGTARYTVEAGRVQDFAAAARPGGDRSGWTLQLRVDYPLGPRERLEFDLHAQRLGSAEIYAPGIVPVRRESNIGQLRLAYVRALPARQQWRLQLRQLTNRDNIALFEYKSTALESVWSRAWP